MPIHNGTGLRNVRIKKHPLYLRIIVNDTDYYTSTFTGYKPTSVDLVDGFLTVRHVDDEKNEISRTVVPRVKLVY